MKYSTISNNSRAHYVNQKQSFRLKVLERIGVWGKEKFFQEFFLPPHKKHYSIPLNTTGKASIRSLAMREYSER